MSNLPVTAPAAPAITPPVELIEGEAKTSSLTVALIFEKDHKHVLRDIGRLQVPDSFRLLNFEPSSYANAQGKQMPMYWLKKDGVAMLTMGYTGKKAMQFKEAYLRANAIPADLLREMRELTAALKNLTHNPAPAAKAPQYRTRWNEETYQLVKKAVLAAEIDPPSEWAVRKFGGFNPLTAKGYHTRLIEEGVIRANGSDGRGTKYVVNGPFSDERDTHYNCFLRNAADGKERDRRQLYADFCKHFAVEMSAKKITTFLKACFTVTLRQSSGRTLITLGE